MKKTRKRLFAFSGIFVVLAQIFVMAFCGVAAVAVTTDDTKKTLFDTENAIATMAYEEIDQNRLKWTVTLEKRNDELSTKFDMQLTADRNGTTSAVIPDNLQVVNQKAESMNLAIGDGVTNSTIYEIEASNRRSSIFTFETGRDFNKVRVTTHLLPVEAKIADLLTGVPETVFDLPIVSEETSDTLETMESKAVESTVETTETSQVESNEETTFSNEVESSESSNQESQTDSTASSENQNNEEATSSSSAVIDSSIADDGITLEDNEDNANIAIPFANVTDGGTLPSNNELVIRSDYDNELNDVNVSVSGGIVALQRSKDSSNGVVNYSNLDDYKNRVFNDYGNVNGAHVVILDSVKGAVITTTYKRVGTYNGQDIGARLTFSNIQKADNVSWTGVDKFVIDFATSLYAGIVYDNIKGMDVSITFTDATGNPIAMAQDSSFITFASLNSNDGAGAEYVFPQFDTTAYRTTGTALNKGIPANSQRNEYPYKNQEAYYGARRFGDNLMDPDYVNGAVSFNINGSESSFTIGSLASRAWTSFMSSVLVPIEPDDPTKTVTKLTAFDDRNDDELDILINGQENQTLNDENITQHSYFINQPLYDTDESIARPTTIRLIDTLPAYVTPTKITLLQSGGYSRVLTEGSNSSRLGNKNNDGRYEIDFKLDSDEMNDIVFSKEGISWRIDVEVDEAYVAANTSNKTITMDNQASIEFFSGDTSLFEKDTNHVATKVVPDLQNITVEKQWKDDENFVDLRKDIVLQLQRKLSTETENKWSNIDEPFGISADATGNDLKHTFNDLPRKENGVSIDYRIVEFVNGKEGAVSGYSLPEYNTKDETLIVVNQLKKRDFEFTKVDGQGKPLDGVIFELTRENGGSWDTVESKDGGAVTFNGLPVGKYTLTESKTVDGYQIEGSWTFEVVDNNGVLEIKGIGDSPIKNGDTVENNLKPFDFTVNKVDDLGEKLIGAEFTLTGPDDYKQVITSTEENPLSSFTFTDLVVPKKGTNTYTLTETKAPDGYAKLANPIIITIGYNDEGKLTITVDGEEVEFSLNKVDVHNSFTYEVANKKLVPLPATGGPGTLLFFVMGILAIAVTGIYFVSRQKQEVA